MKPARAEPDRGPVPPEAAEVLELIAELALRIKARKQKEEAVAKLPPPQKDAPLLVK